MGLFAIKSRTTSALTSSIAFRYSILLRNLPESSVAPRRSDPNHARHACQSRTRMFQFGSRRRRMQRSPRKSTHTTWSDSRRLGMAAAAISGERRVSGDCREIAEPGAAISRAVAQFAAGTRSASRCGCHHTENYAVRGESDVCNPGQEVARRQLQNRAMSPVAPKSEART
jgi:hypothetical protein